tara:strand:+ start:647 stop:799 length:153 start_codon:yes stop_codon:yes gene_type:complete
MEQFFKSLNKRELGIWIKQFTSYELLNQFLNNAPSKEDIKLAKKIYKRLK